MVRVSWCPRKPSRTVYCGAMHVVVDEGVGGAAGSGAGSGMAAPLKVRLRGAAVMEAESAAGFGVALARTSNATRRASSVGHQGARVLQTPGPRPAGTANGAAASTAVGPGRRSSVLQPVSANAPVALRRAAAAASTAATAATTRVGDAESGSVTLGLRGAGPGKSPAGKRSRAEYDHASEDTSSTFGGGPAQGGTGPVTSEFGVGRLSFSSSTVSEQQPQQRRKASRMAPVAKTLNLRKPGSTAGLPKRQQHGVGSPKRRQLASGERPNFEEFHTQFWVEQQERAFTNWLNITIIPTSANHPHSHAAAAAAVTTADSRQRRHAHAAARGRLWQLYSRDLEVRDVILRVEQHVDGGRLRLRGAGDGADAIQTGAKSGGSFMEDVRLRDEFKTALGSYSIFWLRAAVDTILGNPGDVTATTATDSHTAINTVATTASGSAATAATAAAALAKRSAVAADKAEHAALVGALMRDQALEAEFGVGAHGTPPYRDGYCQALAGTVLKRTLLLAFLLDRAQAGLPAHTPLLFRTDATNACKSSAAAVRAALQASCHGEGDVLRHLGHVGYKLYHEQAPIREYDMTCTNLAVDLRDGVRLCRLVEVLSDRCGEKSVLRQVRFPATSRAARLHNVAAALAAARECGVELPASWAHVTPADVVDGHLANTLGLLWALMMHFQAPRMLPSAELDAETGKWNDKRRMQIMSGRGDFVFHGDTLAPGALATIGS